MVVTLRDKAGRYAGSIGFGKSRVPASSPKIGKATLFAVKPAKPTFEGNPKTFEEALQHFNWLEQPADKRSWAQTWEYDSQVATSIYNLPAEEAVKFRVGNLTSASKLLGALWNPALTGPKGTPIDSFYDAMQDYPKLYDHIVLSDEIQLKLMQNASYQWIPAKGLSNQVWSADVQKFLIGDTGGSQKNYDFLLKHVGSQRLVASRKEIDPQIALALTHSTDPDVLTALIDNPYVPSSILTIMSENKNVFVNLQLAASPRVPREAQEELLRRRESVVLAVLAANPAASDECRVMASLQLDGRGEDY